MSYDKHKSRLFPTTTHQTSKKQQVVLSVNKSLLY